MARTNEWNMQYPPLRPEPLKVFSKVDNVEWT